MFRLLVFIVVFTLISSVKNTLRKNKIGTMHLTNFIEENEDQFEICGFSACQMNQKFNLQFNAIKGKVDYLLDFENKVNDLEKNVQLLMGEPVKIENPHLQFGEKIHLLETRLKAFESEQRDNLKNLKEEVGNLSNLIPIFKNPTKGVVTSGPLTVENGDKILEDILQSQTELENDLKDLTKKINNLNINFNESKLYFNSKVEELNRKIETREVDPNAVTRQEIEAIQNLLKGLDKDVNKTKDDKQLLKTDIKKINSAMTDYKNLVKSNLTQLRNEINDLTQENQKLTSTLKSLETELKILKENQLNLTNLIQPINSKVETRNPCVITEPENITVTFDSRKLVEDNIIQHGEKIYYKCADSKYKLEGTSIRKCNDGEWTETEPHCTLNNVTVVVSNSDESQDLYGTPTNKCPLPDGHFRDKDNCSLFYICSAGKATDTPCPPKTFFNRKERKCLWDEPEDCPSTPSP